MPTIALSPAALALFRLHVQRQGQIDVNNSTREPYRELARAGLIRAGSTFRDGEESIYRLTQKGWSERPSYSVARRRLLDVMSALKAAWIEMLISGTRARRGH